MSVVRLTIGVDNAVDTAILYDSIQVWRANESDDSLVYQDITSESSIPAFVDGTSAGPWNLSGQTLVFILDSGESKSISFTGANPLSLAAVLDRINGTFPGIASEVAPNTGRLRLSSPTPGTSSSILISSSLAATSLGLSTERVNGKGARPLLAQTTETYSFVDLDGAEFYWYKTRFFNKTTGSFSEFSEPRRGEVLEVLPDASLLRCFVYLADGMGAPIVGRRVILVPMGQLLVTNLEAEVYGILQSVDRLTMITNESGYAEANLVRGQKFKMFIEGATLQREIVIPTTGTSLNLLQAATTADDPFTIVTAPRMLVRMS